MNTNQLAGFGGITLDIGANWENGGKSRARGMARLTVRLPNATVSSGDRVIMRNGEWQWK